MTKNQDRLQHLFVVYEDGSTEYAIAPLSEMFEYGEHMKPHLTRFRAFTPMQDREDMHAGEDKRTPRKVVNVYDVSAEEMKARSLPWQYEEDVKNGNAPVPRT